MKQNSEMDLRRMLTFSYAPLPTGAGLCCVYEQRRDELVPSFQGRKGNQSPNGGREIAEVVCVCLRTFDCM